MGFIYKNQKISTGIWGLDRLLFGGIQLQSFEGDKFTRPLTIVIQGEAGSSRALFAMQLLHGLCKSINSMKDTYDKGYQLRSNLFIAWKRGKQFAGYAVGYTYLKVYKQNYQRTYNRQTEMDQE